MSLLPKTNVTNLTTKNSQTMSSREIATLTGKEHFTVMRDIRDMLDSLEIEQNTVLHFDNSGANGKRLDFYNLDRELTDCLLTGYSAKLRMAVIKRWHELETKTTTIPTNFADALQLAADTQRQLQLQAPKVAMAEAMFKQHSETGLREFVKANQLPEKLFIQKLMDDEILFRDQSTGTLTPYSHHKHAFVNKKEIINGRVCWRCFITPAGAEWLIENDYHNFGK